MLLVHFQQWQVLQVRMKLDLIARGDHLRRLQHRRQVLRQAVRNANRFGKTRFLHLFHLGPGVLELQVGFDPEGGVNEVAAEVLR